MITFTFYRESNNFDDILNDSFLKKKIYEKTIWKYYLMICLQDDDNMQSYLTLKYGDSIRTEIVADRSPVPGIEYIPIRN